MMTNALVSKSTTYQQLSDVLAELGFQKRVTAQFTAYRNDQFDALLVLPQEALEGPARPLHLAAARATVVGKGIAPADEFDRLMRSHRQAASANAEPAETEKPLSAKKRAKKPADTSAFPDLVSPNP